MVVGNLSEQNNSNTDSAIVQLMTEFTTADQELFLSIARTIEYQKGEIVFQQGDPGDALFVVISGSFEISILSEEGKKLSLNVMMSGDIFGEIAALDGGIRTATATAMEKSKLARYSRDGLAGLIVKNPEMALRIIALLCSRIRWINQQVEDLAMLDVEGRLANRLLILYSRFSDNKGWLKMSQSDLADFLGVSRESTNKILQSWKADGFIELSRGSIKVLDEQRLALISSN